MNRLKYWIAAVIFAAGVGGSAFATVVPQTAGAACEGRFLTMPTWYRGLVEQRGGECNIKSPGKTKQSLATFIWTIALNVVEILLHIVGYAAVGYIIYGGFIYLTSTGQPDKITGAKRSIMNAAIGLVISIFAIAIVNVIVGAF